MLKSKEQYIELIKELGNLIEGERNEVIRHLCKTDIYFLSFFVLDQEFYYNDFAFDFCRKISENPWQLWLVARGHLKSLTITVAHNIQLILNNPDIAIAIPSYNMKTAKSFVRQIKIILESNALLKDLFPKILYLSHSPTISILSAPDIMQNPVDLVFTGFFLCPTENVNQICISLVYHA